MKNVLTIAGSDSSGGAGIQADLKTMLSNRVYGMSVITSLTAQNTQGVTSISDVDPLFVEAQLDAIFSDIRVDAVKIGMVSSVEIIKSIAKKLKEYEVTNIVLDPVAVSTSGFKLLKDEAIDTLKEYLFPLATVITPNMFEAELLLDRKLDGVDSMIEAAKDLNKKFNVATLVKGGHLKENIATDILFYDNEIHVLEENRVDNPNTHGTGCTLSSAIACNIAKGYSLEESVSNAKSYLTKCLNANLDIGKGSGPVDHGYNIECEW